MNNLKLLKSILSAQSYSYNTAKMVAIVAKYAESFGAKVWEEKGNLYAVKGDDSDGTGYPCIVSHTDTVHKIIPDGDYTLLCSEDAIVGYNKSKKEVSGVGGDDKVGIYICLQMLFHLPKIKACFFKDEEVGCKGSEVCDMTFFDDVRYVLQCDRKGNDDFVNKISGDDLQTKDFMDVVEPIIKKYGYSFSIGGMTDVHELYNKGLKVCSANMSCGYYNPHSDNEIVSIKDVFKCEAMVHNIFVEILSKYTAPVKKEKSYGGYYAGGHGGYANHNTKNTKNVPAKPKYKKWSDHNFDAFDYEITKPYVKGEKNKKDINSVLNTCLLPIPLKYQTCWACTDFVDVKDIHCRTGMCKSCCDHHAIPFNNIPF